MKKEVALKATNEMLHGKLLSVQDAEAVWGWSSPAGSIRARRRADMIIQSSNLGKNTRILEIGCGTGLFTEIFSQTEANITALDISEELLNKAMLRNLPATRVTFLKARFEEHDFKGQFDAVIGSSVLHHLELDTALEKIHAILKPGGIACFTEPNMLNPQIFLERNFRKLFPAVSADETAFIRCKFLRQLLAAGFQDVAIIPFDWLHPATPVFLIPFVKLMGGILEKIPIMKEFAGSLYIFARRKL